MASDPLPNPQYGMSEVKRIARKIPIIANGKRVRPENWSVIFFAFPNEIGENTTIYRTVQFMRNGNLWHKIKCHNFSEHRIRSEQSDLRAFIFEHEAHPTIALITRVGEIKFDHSPLTGELKNKIIEIKKLNTTISAYKKITCHSEIGLFKNDVSPGVKKEFVRIVNQAIESSDDQFLFTGDYLKKRDINPIELMAAFSMVGFLVVAKIGDDVRVCL